MKSDSVFLGHILDEIDFVLKATAGTTLDEFTEDEVLRRACTRSFTERHYKPWVKTLQRKLEEEVRKAWSK